LLELLKGRRLSLLLLGCLRELKRSIFVHIDAMEHQLTGVAAAVSSAGAAAVVSSLAASSVVAAAGVASSALVSSATAGASTAAGASTTGSVAATSATGASVVGAVASADDIADRELYCQLVHLYNNYCDSLFNLVWVEKKRESGGGISDRK
jgi:aminopeptidase N